jgi:hypothetical protein
MWLVLRQQKLLAPAAQHKTHLLVQSVAQQVLPLALL